jgi:ABC-type nitrate/sulfonate/bicarbonate transport system ATPase subunit
MGSESRSSKNGFKAGSKLHLNLSGVAYTAHVKGQPEGKPLLTNINVTAESGRLCAVMGPSGAGKTTLLNMMAGGWQQQAAAGHSQGGRPPAASRRQSSQQHRNSGPWLSEASAAGSRLLLLLLLLPPPPPACLPAPPASSPPPGRPPPPPPPRACQRPLPAAHPQAAPPPPPAGDTETWAKGATTGHITLNGQPCRPATLKGISAYVRQGDVLLSTSTVRESLMFHTLLQLPRTLPFSVKKERVDEIIEQLGLQRCADTYIGDDT